MDRSGKAPKLCASLRSRKLVQMVLDTKVPASVPASVSSSSTPVQIVPPSVETHYGEKVFNWLNAMAPTDSLSKGKQAQTTVLSVQEVKRKLQFNAIQSNEESSQNIKSLNKNSGKDSPLKEIPENFFDDDFGTEYWNCPNHEESDKTGNPAVQNDKTRGISCSKKPGKVTMVCRGEDDMFPQFFLDENGCDSPEKGIETTPSSQPISTSQTPSPIIEITPSTSASNVTSSKRKRKVSPRENTRKRKLCPSKWKVNEAKKSFNAGDEHVTPKGLLKKARKMGAGCKPNCRICKSRITEETRVKIFHHFWKVLPSVERKRDFISRSITLKQPASCSTIADRAKKSSREYFLSVNKERVRVCKTQFISTLGVPDCWVETSLIKCKNGFGQSPDKRGRHNNRPHRIHTNTFESVRTHISLFPRVHSHYTRESSKREYLEESVKSIQNMYRLYKKWCSENNVIKPASRDMYSRIFNKEFNIGFFVPKKDQCITCQNWKQAKDNKEREGMISVWSKHLKNKKAVTLLRRADKKSACSTKCVACFDLQKVLPVPRSETSLFFYANKLSLYNFTAFDLRLKHGYCYLWTEVDARKGSNEIATNLFMFIEKKFQEGIKDFVFWSDSPSGQNRNRMIFSMYLWASAKFTVSITHRYLESGHSYSEADSMHALIENTASRKEIFSVEEWINLIEGAKVEEPKYTTHQLSFNDFFDFHHLVNLQDWERDTDNKKVYWSQVREVSVDPDHPNNVFFKYSFEEDPKRANIAMLDGSDIEMAAFCPPLAYKSQIPLPKNKIEHLKMLCKKKAIPSRYHSQFNEIIAI